VIGPDGRVLAVLRQVKPEEHVALVARVLEA
jgi:peroxiredoxin